MTQGKFNWDIDIVTKAEEKKTKVIPRVVASEMGAAQTHIVTAIWG